jgi:hypothetical protein
MIIKNVKNIKIDRKYHNEYILPLYSKYNISHASSSLGMYHIFKYLNSNIQKNDKIILGKPYGILSWFFVENKDEFLKINKLKEYGFDGVLTWNSLEKIKKSKYFNQNNLIDKIIYIDSTLGSALSYTLGLFLTSDTIKGYSGSTFYCIIPDSYLSMGEFYENLYLIKSFLERDLKEISSENKLKIIIDFNQKSKQNKINFNTEDLKKLLKVFLNDSKTDRISFIILDHNNFFDNRGETSI